MNKHLLVSKTPSAVALILNVSDLKIEDINVIASGAKVALDEHSPSWLRVISGSEWLSNLLQDGQEIYGVTTGYGDSCEVAVRDTLINELPLHLTRFHGCGLGRYLDQDETRAVVAARLVSLARGFSGVRPELLHRLAWFLNENVLPLIPAEGSVGASGDLTPLSYVAAAIVGEREVSYGGQILPVTGVYKEKAVLPLTLMPKEGLALMNGTAVMTGLACLAYRRAEYLTRLCSRMTSLAVVALQGNAAHYDEQLFRVKPHPGQNQIAQWIREDLIGQSGNQGQRRLQDRYSLRCAPHIIGVLRDALPMFRQFIETELNSSNDNPIIDPEEGLVLHGGHFYGGHIAFAMDSMKNCVANLADLMDRQMSLLVDPKFNNGLPANLSGAQGSRAALNHGFKAVQIAMSAWTAEALKLTMPASVFSRSTECHNQDKVSMGTIAARDCLRVLELTEQVAAGLIMATVQAVELRSVACENAPSLPQALDNFIIEIRQDFSQVVEDRRLDQDLRRLCENIKHGRWSLYAQS